MPLVGKSAAFACEAERLAGTASGPDGAVFRPAGKTQGFRDFIFWCRLFTFTRPERIRLAIKLAAEYTAQPPDMRNALEICHFFDQDFRGKAERFTAQFGSDAEPEPYYILAKQRAEAMLAEQAAA